MDYMSSALKNLKSKKSPKPMEGSPAEEKMESASKEKAEEEADDKAPDVEDGGLSPKSSGGKPGMMAQESNGDPGELNILKAMSGGGAVGRSSMSLGERAKDKMKERIASIEKNKKKV